MTIQQAMEVGIAHQQAGRLPEAEAIFRQILAQQPNHPEALHAMGVIANLVGQHRVAVELIGRAISAGSAPALYYSNLSAALIGMSQLDHAITAARSAIQRDPDHPEAHNNLGFALQQSGQLSDAIIAYRAAIRSNPEYAQAWNNLGNALQLSGQFDDARVAYLAALRIRPEYADVQNNLGGLLKWSGQLDEAIECYRHAIALRPDWPLPHSNLLYTMHFSPSFDTSTLLQEHRLWNQRHAQSLPATIQPHTTDHSPDRRLRIGYVSPDFREHPVSRFLLPLLAHHNRQNVEVVCYSDVLTPDAITQRVRAHADSWHEVIGMSDDQLAQLIRSHQIDILVDLTMHMDRNRLLTFARKPAPVQVTYLAYCSTTGLEAMDYRLSDPYLDPRSQAEPAYCETTICLPRTYWCYEPALPMSETGPLPTQATGHVTFGCLNNFCKVTANTLESWCGLLQSVPDSRLLLHTHEGSHRRRISELFDQRGVDSQRLTFVGMLPLVHYMESYQKIDIALDPFPYSGGTTTCDALWMGVPVITLHGRTAVGRAGVSILSNIGLPELIARDEKEYIQIATALAGDLPRLAQLRATLRQRMQASPLCDAPRFAADVEDAYRQMWRRWCNAAATRT